MTPILPRTSPAAVGLDPAAVQLLVDGLDKIDAVHTVILVRDGHVVAEAAWAPHTLDRPHMTFSVSKSFTSMAVGLAIEEGRFGLDDRVVDLLADDAPAQPSANLAAMTVRHLLTMTGGHAADTIGAIDQTTGGWARQLLARPVEHEPGTRPVYNTGSTYLLGAIVQRRTGQRLLDYLRPRLLDPLDITTATWEQDPDGLDLAGTGLSITTEELAAFGQLCRQRGHWRGRQLVPAAWVDAATAIQVAQSPALASASPTRRRPDWEQGYGFQFWQCRHGAYRADGAFGQFAVVWPEHNIVIAINAGTADMQSILDVVWASLLPALPAVRTTSPAGEAPATFAHRLPPPAGAPASPREASILGVTYALDTPIGEISHLTLTRDEQHRLVIRLLAGGQEQAIPVGYGEWVPGVLALGGPPTEVASAAAWADESRLVARTVTLGTPYTATLALRFVDDRLELALDLNVAFGPTHLGHATAHPVVP